MSAIDVFWNLVSFCWRTDCVFPWKRHRRNILSFHGKASDKALINSLLHIGLAYSLYRQISVYPAAQVKEGKGVLDQMITFGMITIQLNFEILGWNIRQFIAKSGNYFVLSRLQHCRSIAGRVSTWQLWIIKLNCVMSVNLFNMYRWSAQQI